jgi:hypothetical protein
MSPPAITRRDNSSSSLENFQQLTRRRPNTTIDRCFFLLVHLVFYVIILIIVYVRLGQFNSKHDKILVALNLTTPPESSNHNVDCSCQTIPFPRRNRTTRCLELRVGLTDTISNVFCPISSDVHEHNQWLTIQSRQSNQIDFNRTWIEYRRGFGNIQNQIDFWIGNENLHWLTNSYSCRLKIELTDWYNETRTATYEIFRIANQHDGYRIQISEYHGDMEISNKIDSERHFFSLKNYCF